MIWCRDSGSSAVGVACDCAGQCPLSARFSAEWGDRMGRIAKVAVVLPRRSMRGGESVTMHRVFRRNLGIDCGHLSLCTLSLVDI